MTRRYERIGKRMFICVIFALVYTAGALTCHNAPAKQAAVDPQCEWAMAKIRDMEGKTETNGVIK